MGTGMGSLAVLIFAMGIATAVAAVPNQGSVESDPIDSMIAQANQTQAGDQSARDRALGICRPVPSNYYGGENTLIPLVAVKNYFTLYDPQTTFTGPATLTVLQQPQHGILRLVTQADVGTILPSGGDPVDPAAGLYFYLPEQGYLGDDKASFLIERGGIKIKVVYYFKAVNGPLGNSGGDEYCEKTGIRWKISSTLDANGTSTLADQWGRSMGSDSIDLAESNRIDFVSTLVPSSKLITATKISK